MVKTSSPADKDIIRQRLRDRWRLSRLASDKTRVYDQHHELHQQDRDTNR
jgi:hypothetical protein